MNQQEQQITIAAGVAVVGGLAAYLLWPSSAHAAPPAPPGRTWTDQERTALELITAAQTEVDRWMAVAAVAHGSVECGRFTTSYARRNVFNIRRGGADRFRSSWVDAQKNWLPTENRRDRGSVDDVTTDASKFFRVYPSLTACILGPKGYLGLIRESWYSRAWAALTAHDERYPYALKECGYFEASADRMAAAWNTERAWLESLLGAGGVA